MEDYSRYSANMYIYQRTETLTPLLACLFLFFLVAPCLSLADTAQAKGDQSGLQLSVGCSSGFGGSVLPPLAVEKQLYCDNENLKKFSFHLGKCEKDVDSTDISNPLRAYDIDKDGCITCKDFTEWQKRVVTLHKMGERLVDASKAKALGCNKTQADQDAEDESWKREKSQLSFQDKIKGSQKLYLHGKYLESVWLSRLAVDEATKKNDSRLIREAKRALRYSLHNRLLNDKTLSESERASSYAEIEKIISDDITFQEARSKKVSFKIPAWSMITLKNQLADILAEQKKYQEAIKVQREIVSLYSQDDTAGARSAKLKLSLFLAQSGDVAEAIDKYEQAIDGYINSGKDLMKGQIIPVKRTSEKIREALKRDQKSYTKRFESAYEKFLAKYP